MTTAAAYTTEVPSGTYTLGGVTTAIETATTLVCPYATTKSAPGGGVTSCVETTTTYLPSPGTYTIAPHTVTVTVTKSVVVVPVLATYSPGTYTAAATTVTVTEASSAFVCPFTTPTPTPTTTSSTSSYAHASSSETVSAKKTYSTYKAKPSKVPEVSPGLGSTGDLWAMTYTPYSNGGGCKSAGEVLADITRIRKAGFTSLRGYSTDCDYLANVGAAARANGMKIMVGIFIDEPGCENTTPSVAQQISAITSWAQWDLVELAIVGNEAGHNEYCTASQLASLISHVKGVLRSQGCQATVTTSDTLDVYLRPDFASAICAVVDVAAINAHAYFNAGTPPQSAGVFVQGQLSILEGICSKKAYVLETGYPSSGAQNGLAICSKQDQEVAIKSIIEVVGSQVVFFSFENDLWKEAGQCQCEQSWGCIDVFEGIGY